MPQRGSDQRFGICLAYRFTPRRPQRGLALELGVSEGPERLKRRHLALQWLIGRTSRCRQVVQLVGQLECHALRRLPPYPAHELQRLVIAAPERAHDPTRLERPEDGERQTGAHAGRALQAQEELTVHRTAEAEQFQRIVTRHEGGVQIDFASRPRQPLEHPGRDDHVIAHPGYGHDLDAVAPDCRKLPPDAADHEAARRRASGPVPIRR